MKTAYYDYVTVTMHEDAVTDLTQSGDVSDVVNEWSQSIEIDGTPDNIRSLLSQYGAWDDIELSDDTMNRQRLAWIAAGDILDGLFDSEVEE